MILGINSSLTAVNLNYLKTYVLNDPPILHTHLLHALGMKVMQMTPQLQYNIHLPYETVSHIYPPTFFQNARMISHYTHLITMLLRIITVFQAECYIYSQCHYA